MKLFLLLALCTISLKAFAAPTLCDQRLPEDIAEATYGGESHGGWGYQLDWGKQLNDYSYDYEVRICSTSGYNKCHIQGVPDMGTTYAIKYRPTSFGNSYRNQRCLVSVTVIGH
jgi:hypothetical protein